MEREPGALGRPSVDRRKELDGRGVPVARRVRGLAGGAVWILHWYSL
jgi:hypothetical protein